MQIRSQRHEEGTAKATRRRVLANSSRYSSAENSSSENICGRAGSVSSAFTTANTGNPPSRQMPYSSWAPQFWSSQGLPVVVQAKASVRGSMWSATISSPAVTW